VAWQFDKKGQIYIDAARYDEDATMMAALEAGAEDVAREGDLYVVTTDPTEFHAVQDALRGQKIEIESAELTMIPKTTVRVEGADVAKLIKLLEALEDLDDVQKVHSNMDVDEAALEGAEA
jgi:transcriptional/translational regulatory protein YebC/TACO1